MVMAMLALVAILAALATPAAARAAGGQATDIVQLSAGTTLAEGRAAVRAAGGEVTGSIPIIDSVAARLRAPARAALRRDARVRVVSPNSGVRRDSVELNDSLLSTTYPLSSRASSAWSFATGKGVGVAVIDTGIDGTRRDFADAQGNSRIAASVVTNPGAHTAADTFGHGTHVAGIIAGNGSHRVASDPLAGRYIGIAPDADLISVKAGDDEGNATVLDVIYGLQFVVDHRDDYRIRVVNLSLSSTEPGSYKTDPLDAAVEAAYFHGIVVVAAAGNRGSGEDAADYAPGNDPFAITVGAVDEQGTTLRRDDVTAAWPTSGVTEDGFRKPELVAPGVHMASVLAHDSAFSRLCPSCVVDDDYIVVSGTSMAAPVVSGMAALILEAHPHWTPDAVKSTLMVTARALEGGEREADAVQAVLASQPSGGANADLAASELVDPATGDIDETRSSWGRSSWGSAPEGLEAPWARSSWGCACGASGDGSVETARSSWGSLSWSMRWTE